MKQSTKVSKPFQKELVDLSFRCDSIFKALSIELNLNTYADYSSFKGIVETLPANITSVVPRDILDNIHEYAWLRHNKKSAPISSSIPLKFSQVTLGKRTPSIKLDVLSEFLTISRVPITLRNLEKEYAKKKQKDFWLILCPNRSELSVSTESLNYTPYDDSENVDGSIRGDIWTKDKKHSKRVLQHCAFNYSQTSKVHDVIADRLEDHVKVTGKLPTWKYAMSETKAVLKYLGRDQMDEVVISSLNKSVIYAQVVEILASLYATKKVSRIYKKRKVVSFYVPKSVEGVRIPGIGTFPVKTPTASQYKAVNNIIQSEYILSILLGPMLEGKFIYYISPTNTGDFNG